MTLFQLEPITIPAGDTVAMEYEFVLKDGSVPDYSTYTAYYVLSQYGFEDSNILSESMILKQDTTNVFSVTLDSETTAELEPGTYTAKIVLSDGTNYFKKARGVFNVVKDTDGVGVG